MDNQTNDQYKVYFAEKLWEMIPAVYRNDGSVNDQSEALRAVVEILAQQAAALRRSQDRLWDDQFIDLCSDWVVPYLADLLGTRLISIHDKRGRRIDVAKTIYYRRRKGTVRVLEELVNDISGWEGKVAENFQRLIRSRHGLDPLPACGRLSGTPQGGIVDIRHPFAGEQIDGPFDEYSHTPDFRRHKGKLGWYAIPKLAFFLYRLAPFTVQGVTPFSIQNGTDFSFDPSGRKVSLFMPKLRSKDWTWDAWHSATEWEMPGPMSSKFMDRFAVKNFKGVTSLEIELEDSTHSVLTVQHGELNQLHKIELETGIFKLLNPVEAAHPEVSFTYGFSGAVGAGPYQRVFQNEENKCVLLNGGGKIRSEEIDHKGKITVIQVSKTYGPVGNKEKIEDLYFTAGNEQRPYLRLDGNWILKSGIEDACLTIEGLWVGASGASSVILRGNFEQVIIKHCTLDPGATADCIGNPVLPVPIMIEGYVEKLKIESSIVASIQTTGDGFVEQFEIVDSIVQQVNKSGYLLDINGYSARVNRSTIFGDINVNRLDASELIVLGRVVVTNRQNGCFRFSATHKSSLIPNPYQSFLYDTSSKKIIEGTTYWFTSISFGHPGYAQLSEAAPAEVQRGAENGSEMGVYSQLLNPIKMDSLRAKVEEYLPFGLIPLFINET